MKDSGLSLKHIWRIRSRQAEGKPTRLIRIVTESKTTLDTLLSRGITLWGQRYRVEASRPPKPQPYQCQEFHALETCRKETACRICGEQHHESKCKLEAEKAVCKLCQGNHPANSWNCPKRPKEPALLQVTVPVSVVAPSGDEEEENLPTPTIHQMLRFVTATALNIAPRDWERISFVMRNLAREIFGTHLSVTYAHSKIHVTCKPMSYPVRSTYG